MLDTDVQVKTRHKTKTSITPRPERHCIHEIGPRPEIGQNGFCCFFYKKNFSDVAASAGHQLVEIPGLDSLGRRKRRWKGKVLDFQLSLKKWIILLI